MRCVEVGGVVPSQIFQWSCLPPTRISVSSYLGLSVQSALSLPSFSPSLTHLFFSIPSFPAICFGSFRLFHFILSPFLPPLSASAPFLSPTHQKLIKNDRARAFVQHQGEEEQPLIPPAGGRVPATRCDCDVRRGAVRCAVYSLY